MKKGIYLFALILSSILISQVAHATGLQMLSQTYHAEADYPATAQNSLDGSPVTAYSHEYRDTSGPPFHDPRLSYETEASASVGTFGAFAMAHIIQTSLLEPMADADASGDWVFRPLYDSLLINIDLSFHATDYFYDEWFAKITLTDLVTATTLISIDDECRWGSFTCSVNGVRGDIVSPQTYEFIVDPNHDYEFFIESYAGVYNWATASIEVNASVDSVPEPTTMLLLGLGLVGLAGVRRKIQK